MPSRVAEALEHGAGAAVVLGDVGAVLADGRVEMARDPALLGLDRVLHAPRRLLVGEVGGADAVRAEEAAARILQRREEGEGALGARALAEAEPHLRELRDAGRAHPRHVAVGGDGAVRLLPARDVGHAASRLVAAAELPERLLDVGVEVGEEIRLRRSRVQLTWRR